MKTLRALAATAALIAPLASQAGLVNGNFEANAIGAGSWTILPTLTGWTGGPLGIELRNGVSGTAKAGKHYVELDTTGNSAMWQDVDTDEGQYYFVTGWYSPRAGVAADSNDIQVFWNTTLLGTLSGSGIGKSDHDWKAFSFGVFGTAATTDRLRFAAAGRSDSLGGSLDQIALTAVPEPGSLALVLAAFGAAALARRKAA